MRPGEFWDMLKLTFTEWWNDNTFRLAASLAFYTVFSISPIVVIAIWVAGTVFGEENARNELVKQVSLLTGDQGGAAIGQILEGAGQATSGSMGLAIGLVIVLVSSTVVFAELQSALNQIWDVKADPERGIFRQLLRDRLRSFGIVLAVGFLLMVSLVTTTVINAARNELTSRFEGLSWLWTVLNQATAFVLVALLFALIYKYLPDVRIRWRDVAIGAVVTSVLFNVGKWAVGAYLGQMAVGNAYGAAGSFAVLLIWVYYSALISFVGAEFTQVYARRYGMRIQPKPHAVRIGQKPDHV